MDTIEFLVGNQHANAIKLELRNDDNLHMTKSANKVNFGFYKKGLLNGLGVTLRTKDPASIGSYNIDTHRRNDDFHIKTIQRGYFVNSQIHGMG